MYSLLHPKQQRILGSVVSDLIVGCSFPLSLVEKPQFRRFCQVLDPQARDISRSAVFTELNRLYTSVKKDLTDLLGNADRIAVTVDIWSDNRMRGYLGVTAHFIANYSLMSKLLSCERFH